MILTFSLNILPLLPKNCDIFQTFSFLEDFESKLGPITDILSLVMLAFEP